MTSYPTFGKNNRLRQLSSTDLLEKMHTAISHSMDGIALLNAQGEYYYLNDVHLSMFGYGEEGELIGKTWQCIYGETEIERINSTIFPLLIQKGKWKGETIGKSKEGIAVFQEITLSLLQDGGIICICRDISQRLINQKKLLLHNSILQNTKSIVIITDSSRNIEWVNHSFCQLTGYSADEVTGKNLGKLLQGKNSDAATINSFRDALLNKAPFSSELLNYKKDGTPYWVEIKCQPLFNEQGEVEKYFAIEENITDRKQKEQELFENNLRLEFAIEGAQGAMWDWDITNKLTHYSVSWKKQLGCDDNEISNSLSEWTSRIHPDDLQKTLTTLEHYIAGKKTLYEAEVRIRHKSGAYLHFLDRGKIIKWDEQGNPARMIGVAFNISALKESQEKYKTILDASGAAIWEWNIQQGKMIVNDKLAKMYGFEQAADLPESFNFLETVLTHSDDRERLRHEVSEHMKGKTEGFDLDYRCRKINEDRYEWFNIKGAVSERTPEGLPLKAVGSCYNIQQRKEAEEKLTESENRLQLAITNSESGLWEWDTQTKHFKISDNSRKISGITKGTFETVTDFINRLHPEDADKALRDFQNHFEKKTDSYISEYRILDDSGNYKWLLSKGKLIPFGEEEAHTGVFLGTFTDITHSKEVEIKLKENEQKMRMALNSVHGGLWENDLEIDMFYLYELDKQTRKKINAPFMYWEDLVSRIHPDDLEKVTTDRTNFLHGQTAQYETEYRFKTDDGNYMWVNAVGSVSEKDINGKPSKIVGIFTDVTERKLAEEKLKENEQRWNFALEGAGAGVFDINFLTGHAYYSRKLKNILGYTEEEFPDSFDEWYKLVHPDDYKHVKESLDKFINGEVTTYQTEQRALHKDGHCMWFSNKVYLIRTPDGKPERMIGTIIEITESKRIQIELQRSKDLAEASVRSKQLFLANISHELRTPMHAIIGIGEQLSKSELTVTQKNQLNVISESANFLLSIIDDILDLSKIEEGKMRFEEYPFTLTDVVNSCFNLVKEKAEAKGLRINSNLDPLFNQTYYLGDANRVKQVFLNILSNAVKFTEKGFITFNCKLVKHELKQHTIAVTCIDTGIGIGEQMMQRLFQDFSQEDESFIRKYGGTGLGLSITKSLVEMMGGRIEIDSHKATGTSVTIHFTFRIAEKDRQKESPNNNSLQPDTALLKNRKILVAEDNKFNRLLLKIIFDKYNIELTEAQNGKEAVELAAAGTFDMILMDIQMPEMDGVEATKYIREVLKKDIPILAITANAVTEELEEYKAQGIDDTLTKPFEEKKLLEKLFQFIHN